MAVRTIRMLKSSPKPGIDISGTTWQMNASKALKFDEEERLRKKDSKKDKNKIQIKRTIHVPDEKPKISNTIAYNICRLQQIWSYYLWQPY